MSKVKIELNSAGIRSILKNEAAEPCRRAAQNVAAGLDGNLYRYYEISTSQRRGGGVSTAGIEGIQSNRKHNTLAKALGSAKG